MVAVFCRETQGPPNKRSRSSAKLTSTVTDSSRHASTASSPTTPALGICPPIRRPSRCSTSSKYCNNHPSSTRTPTTLARTLSSSTYPNTTWINCTPTTASVHSSHRNISLFRRIPVNRTVSTCERSPRCHSRCSTRQHCRMISTSTSLIGATRTSCRWHSVSACIYGRRNPPRSPNCWIWARAIKLRVWRGRSKVP